MAGLSNFEVNIWSNVAADVLLNQTSIPKSFERIKIRNLETLDAYKPF
jgi:hypothetical protein